MTSIFISRQFRGTIAALSLVLFGYGLFEFVSLTQFEYRLSYEEGLEYRGRYSACILALLFAAISAGINLGSNQKTLRVAAVVTPTLSIVLLVILLVGPGNLGVHSITSARNECANNLRAVERGKVEWAVQHGAEIGSVVKWDDLASIFSNGHPVCPEAGVYTIGKLGEGPFCSITNHNIFFDVSSGYQR